MRATHPYHVIKGPVLSEESTIQTSAHNKYVFRVDPRANKQQIRTAIEQQWPDVRVTSVNTMNYRGKARRRAGSPGATSAWKKAIVTLRPEDKIELI
jgi:large subunit ribosomal protein L23